MRTWEISGGLDLEHDDLTETSILLIDKFEVWSQSVIVSKLSQTGSILPDIAAKVLTMLLACSTLSNSNHVKHEKRGKKCHDSV